MLKLQKALLNYISAIEKIKNSKISKDLMGNFRDDFASHGIMHISYLKKNLANRVNKIIPRNSRYKRRHPY